MSALALAPRAPRDCSASNGGLTPDQELELLIAEQQKDDTYFVLRDANVVSLDSVSPNAYRSIADLVGLDEEGELVSFLPPVGGLVDATQIPHGTLGGYNNHRCRCLSCKRAIADYRQRRRTSRS